MIRARLARWAALVIASAAVAAAGPAPGSAAAAPVPAPATLVAVRAAHHPGYDRIVFEFRGPLPARRSAEYVSQVIGDPSGLPVPLAGSAFVQLRFSPARGHDDSGRTTYSPTRQTFALPEMIQVAGAGDFENVLSFGLGVARKEPLHLTTLTNPSRVVLDIDTPFRTVPVKDYFFDQQRVVSGRPPLTRPVNRPVIPPAVAAGALQRLFAGPTQAERAAGLRLVSSHATGFTGLSVRDGVARVTLTGGCNSDGSTMTVASEIMPTLKQFDSVRWVKVYDPSGHTERPSGDSDSIPECLEP